MIKRTFIESIAINQGKSSGKKIKSVKKGVFSTIFDAQKSKNIQNKKAKIDNLPANLKTDKNSLYTKKTLEKLEKMLENIFNSKQHKSKEPTAENSKILDLIKKIKILLSDESSSKTAAAPKGSTEKTAANIDKHRAAKLEQAAAYLINIYINTQQKLNEENTSGKETLKNGKESDKTAADNKNTGKPIKIENTKLNSVKSTETDNKTESNKDKKISAKNTKSEKLEIFSTAKKTIGRDNIVLNNVSKKADINSKNTISSSDDKGKTSKLGKPQNDTFNNAKNIVGLKSADNLNGTENMHSKISSIAEGSVNIDPKHHIDSVQNHKDLKKSDKISVKINKSVKIEDNKIVDIKKIKTDGNVKITKDTVSSIIPKNHQNSNTNSIAGININTHQKHKKTADKSFSAAKVLKAKNIIIKNKGLFKVSTGDNIKKIDIKNIFGGDKNTSENQNGTDYKDAQKTVNTGFAGTIGNVEQAKTKQAAYPINKVIDKILELQNLQPPFNKTITIKISPPYLGTIQIKVSMDKDKNLSTAISTKDKNIFNILNFHIGDMKECLTNNGIKMQDINIFNNFNQNSSQQNNQNQFTFGSGGNPQGQNQHFSQSDETKFLKTESLENDEYNIHREGLNIIV